MYSDTAMNSGIFQTEYFNDRVPDKIIGLISLSVSSVSVFGIAFLAAIWLLYFLFRVRELSRKIHYLKKQTDERCEQELTNAKVDYIKSVFIAAICLSEVLAVLFITTSIVVKYVVPNGNLTSTCTGPDTIRIIHNNREFRMLGAATLTFVISFLSLTHISTIYLAKAYDVKRVITITKGVKILLIFMAIQIIITWLSVINWLAYIYVSAVNTGVLLICHLYLYKKYSKELLVALERRRLDNWYEDSDSFNKLDKMCRDYGTSRKLYFICIILVLIDASYSLVISLIKLVIQTPCAIKLLFFIDFNPQIESNLVTDIFFRIFDRVLVQINSMVMLLLVFALHLIVLFRAFSSEIRRRKAYKNFVNNKDMSKHLLGNN